MKNQLLRVELVVGVLQPADDVLAVVRVVRKASIREMLFPDKRVIIPCSVRLKNRMEWWELACVQHHGGRRRQTLVSEFANFPVIFPVSREFGPENGSQETLPTATMSRGAFRIK